MKSAHLNYNIIYNIIIIALITYNPDNSSGRQITHNRNIINRLTALSYFVSRLKQRIIL